MTDRKPIDWERIEAQYRAGTLSIREIAKQFGITETAIRKRAKRDKWERDLSAKVQQKVRTAMVRITPVRTESPTKPQTEKQTVDAAARTVIEVLVGQRRDIEKGRNLVDTLMDQLELAVGSRDDFQTAIEEMTHDDKTPQRYNALMRAVALPTHITAAKDLGQAMRHLIALQRQAYGLAESDDPTPKEVTADADPAADALAAARERHRKRLGLPDPGNKADSA